MGNWQLEIGRMAMYLSFPVALFYWFNLPGNAEKCVQEFPQRPVDNDEHLREEFNKLIDDFNTGKIPRKLGFQNKENATIK